MPLGLDHFPGCRSADRDASRILPWGRWLVHFRPCWPLGPSVPFGAEIFGLAAQHFLLPSLVERLAILRWLRQFLLSAREFVELLQRVVDILSRIPGGIRVCAVSYCFSRCRVRGRRGLRGPGLRSPPPPPPPLRSPKATWICRNVASACNRCCNAFCSSRNRIVPLLLANLSAAGSSPGPRRHVLVKRPNPRSPR